jgi:hypothetical protein
MPFPNEHAARQRPPGQFDKFRRGKLPGAPAGISAIFGIKAGKSAIQSIRFARGLWTVARAKAWLKRNNFKTAVEPATKKTDWGGVL